MDITCKSLLYSRVKLYCFMMSLETKTSDEPNGLKKNRRSHKIKGVATPYDSAGPRSVYN